MRRTLFAALALTACTGSTEPEAFDIATDPAELSIVSGDAQSDTIDATLASPVVVELLSADGLGTPVSGVVVNFRVLEEGCGEPFAGSAITDENGHATERWELGTAAGECTMEARAVDADGTPRVFATATATIEPGMATGAFRAARDTSAWIGDVVFDSRVRDRAGNLIAGKLASDPLPTGVSMHSDTLRSTGEVNASIYVTDSAGYYEGETSEVSWYADLGRGSWRATFVCTNHVDPSGPDSLRVRLRDPEITWTTGIGEGRNLAGSMTLVSDTMFQYWPDSTVDTLGIGSTSPALEFDQRPGELQWRDERSGSSYDFGAATSAEAVPTTYTGGNWCTWNWIAVPGDWQAGGSVTFELAG